MGQTALLWATGHRPGSCRGPASDPRETAWKVLGGAPWGRLSLRAGGREGQRVESGWPSPLRPSRGAFSRGFLLLYNGSRFSAGERASASPATFRCLGNVEPWSPRERNCWAASSHVPACPGVGGARVVSLGCCSLGQPLLCTHRSPLAETRSPHANGRAGMLLGIIHLHRSFRHSYGVQESDRSGDY